MGDRSEIAPLRPKIRAAKSSVKLRRSWIGQCNRAGTNVTFLTVGFSNIVQMTRGDSYTPPTFDQPVRSSHFNVTFLHLLDRLCSTPGLWDTDIFEGHAFHQTAFDGEYVARRTCSPSSVPQSLSARCNWTKSLLSGKKPRSNFHP